MSEQERHHQPANETPAPEREAFFDRYMDSGGSLDGLVDLDEYFPRKREEPTGESSSQQRNRMEQDEFLDRYMDSGDSLDGLIDLDEYFPRGRGEQPPGHIVESADPTLPPDSSAPPDDPPKHG